MGPSSPSGDRLQRGQGGSGRLPRTGPGLLMARPFSALRSFLHYKGERALGEGSGTGVLVLGWVIAKELLLGQGWE